MPKILITLAWVLFLFWGTAIASKWPGNISLQSSRTGLHKLLGKSETAHDRSLLINQKPLEPCTTDLCPPIAIECDNQCVGRELRFRAYFTFSCPGRKPTYKWKVSAGKIVSGQGTDTITVDSRRAGKRSISVTVEIGNAIPDSCRDTATLTIGRRKTQSSRK
jgi:hypothetical protein